MKKDSMDVAMEDERQTSLWSDETAELEPEDGNGVPDLKHLRELSRERISKCKHCGGPSKVYAYKMGAYARVLCWLSYMENSSSSNNKYKSRGNYFHVPSSGAINGGGDYAKLRFWGLIEAMPNDNPLKRSSGMWRLTTLGREFVFGRTTVSAVCYYRHPEGGILGFEPGQIDIATALGKNFSYPSLMQGYTTTKHRR